MISKIIPTNMYITELIIYWLLEILFLSENVDPFYVVGFFLLNNFKSREKLHHKNLQQDLELAQINQLWNLYRMKITTQLRSGLYLGGVTFTFLELCPFISLFASGSTVSHGQNPHLFFNCISLQHWGASKDRSL